MSQIASSLAFMLSQPGTYVKAIYGALVAGLAALGTAYSDNGVTAVEWIGIASSVVVAFGVIFNTTNDTPTSKL